MATLIKERSENKARYYQMALKALRLGEKINMATLGPDSVTHEMRTKGEPYVLFHYTDEHWGAEGADHDHILDKVGWLSNSRDHFVVSTGDEMDFKKKEYGHSVRSPLDAEAQYDTFSHFFFHPLLGILLGVVGYYDSHVGWELINGGDPWARMRREGINTPRQGGRIILSHNSGLDLVTQVWHDAGRSVAFNPLQGLREKAAEWDDNDPQKPRIYLAGHHHFTAIGQEIGIRGHNLVTFSQGGTEKGNSPERVDRHTALRGGRIYDPPGNTMVIYERHNKLNVYASPTSSRADKLQDAFELLNRAEQLGVASELKLRIRNEVEAGPTVELNPDRTRLVGEKGALSPDSGQTQTPKYSEIGWNFKTKMPVRIIMAANFRFGSASAIYNRKYLYDEVVTPAKTDPYTFVLGLRHWVDPDEATDPNRKTILDQIVTIFAPLASRGKLLDVMLSGSMRAKGWKKRVGEGIDGDPIQPGAYLASALKVPLIQHKSIVNIELDRGETNKRNIKITAVDQTAGSNSSFNPVLGLRRVYDWQNTRSDIVVGGKGSKAALEYFYDRHNMQTNHPLLIATGWYSDVDSWGPGNVQEGGPGGQSITICSDNNVYASLEAQASEDTFKALFLWEGIRLLGINPKRIHSKK